jgi:hypothetical protein
LIIKLQEHSKFDSLVKSQKACHCDLPAIGFALGKAGWAERSNPWPRPEPHWDAVKEKLSNQKEQD